MSHVFNIIIIYPLFFYTCAYLVKTRIVRTPAEYVGTSESFRLSVFNNNYDYDP